MPSQYHTFGCIPESIGGAKSNGGAEAGLGGLGGWRTRLPRRGGVERRMNSIWVGSLEEARRSAGWALVCTEM